MRAITTKYIGPTSYRGSRIKAWDSEGNTVTIPYPHEAHHDDAYAIAAIALCKKMDWKGELVSGGTKQGQVFVFADSQRYQIV